jgi:uncharacterized protein YndB with AHSA1/START domain
VSARKLEIVAEQVKKSFTTRRVVAAPRELVFECFTRPDYLRRWLGPCNLTTTVCEVDLRVGGAWRTVHRAPDGQDFAFYGEFREIVRPVRIVRTYIFGHFPDAVALETLELEADGRRTIVKTTTLHGSVAARDGHLGSGMEHGMRESYEQLDALLVELVAEATSMEQARI